MSRERGAGGLSCWARCKLASTHGSQHLHSPAAPLAASCGSRQGLFDPLVAEVRQPSEAAPLRSLDVAAFAAHLFDLGAPRCCLQLPGLGRSLLWFTAPLPAFVCCPPCCATACMLHHCYASQLYILPGGNYLRGARLAACGAEALLTTECKAYQPAVLRRQSRAG